MDFFRAGDLRFNKEDVVYYCAKVITERKWFFKKIKQYCVMIYFKGDHTLQYWNATQEKNDRLIEVLDEIYAIPPQTECN